MTEVVGVRFKQAGRIYFFAPKDIDLKEGDRVVVDTGRGFELGYVVVTPKKVSTEEVVKPLKSVVRKADEKDIKHVEEFEGKEKEAFEECVDLITKLNLPMKLLSAEYNLSGTRLTFFFSADGRVDFRELVRKLTNRFKVQVELRQVGPRDETKLMGGLGRCGRLLCCMNFLTDFSPVSIKMAKEQSLPLNPMKISGICGRLLCCLGYENELYREMRAKLPKEGKKVSTSSGIAKVVGSNPLKETVFVEVEGGAKIELPLRDIKILD